MITLVRSIIAGQYGAALSMLRGCIERAAPDAWLAVAGQFPFWHIAYHTLYTTDLYLSEGEEAFQPQPFHINDYHLLGPQPWSPKEYAAPERPYEKEQLLGYVETCWAKARETIDGETETTLAGPSGFWWLKLTRLEHHIYNIRHVQHHSGQLGAVIRSQQGEGVEWVGSVPLAPRQT